jgi:hypothetical protein
MTHYAVLRHGFDIHHNPDRLGPRNDEEKFWLSLGSGGESPSWLVGNTLWLISWEGFMKTHHVICGWYTVSRVGKRAGVVAQHYAAGNEGELYPRALGPLDVHPWFHKFVEAHRKFREGEPTDLEEFTNDVLSLARGAGARVPAAAAWGEVAQGPAAM